MAGPSAVVFGAYENEGESLEDGVASADAEDSVAGEARVTWSDEAGADAADCCRTCVDTAAVVDAGADVGVSKAESLLSETGTRTIGPVVPSGVVKADEDDAMAETDAEVSVVLSCAAAIAMQRATEVSILIIVV